MGGTTIISAISAFYSVLPAFTSAFTLSLMNGMIFFSSTKPSSISLIQNPMISVVSFVAIYLKFSSDPSKSKNLSKRPGSFASRSSLMISTGSNSS